MKTTTASCSGGVTRYLRKKIAVGLEKTAKIDTKTWSSALSGARNIRTSSTLVVLGLSNDLPIRGARPRAIPPSSTMDGDR